MVVYHLELKVMSSFVSATVFSQIKTTVFSLGIATVNIVSEGSELAGF